MRYQSLAVGMGEGIVAYSPYIISTYGIGSCVVVTVYDTYNRIGGLAHVMLPDVNSVKQIIAPYQCADKAITALLKWMHRDGAVRDKIVAKVIGGAKMFLFTGGGDGSNLGERNTASVRRILKEERIPIISEDTEGNYGRRVDFYLDSGKVVVKVVGCKDKEI